MKKTGGKLINTLLAAGMLFVFIIFLFSFGFAGSEAAFLLKLFPVIIFMCGLIFLFIFVRFSRTSFKLFTAVLFLTCGFYSALLIDKNIPLDFSKGWPIFLILASLSLFIAGRLEKRRSSFTFDFPSVVLLVIGIVFSLFSLRLSNLPFEKAAAFAFPVLIGAACMILIFLFVKRKEILKILPKEISDDLTSGGEEGGEEL
ncbi:MAG: hypothetical protein ACTTKX_05130 [Treponema sp.]